MVDRRHHEQFTPFYFDQVINDEAQYSPSNRPKSPNRTKIGAGWRDARREAIIRGLTFLGIYAIIVP
jgi:hypothetical protein